MRAVSGWIVGNYMQCTPGSSARTQGTAVPREREAQTEQHMLGHRFPAWNKSTGLSFISNVCDLHERTTVTQPQQCVVCRGLIDRISYFACNHPARRLLLLRHHHHPAPLPKQLDDDCCIIAQNMLPVELVWNVALLCWARDGRWHLLSVILRNESH